MDLTNEIPDTTRAKSWLQTRIDSFSIWWLLGIFATLHLFVINYPNQQNAYIFDEAYYIPDAHDLMTGVASNLEHPFLGKAWIGFGEILSSTLGGSYLNTFFPRLIEVGFGLGALYVFWLLCNNWFSRNVSLFATAMLGLDTLFFAHTSIAVLDGPPLFFAFVGMLFYFNWRKRSNDNYLTMSALAFGLAVLSKETAVLFVVIIAFYHIFTTKRDTMKLRPMVAWFVGIVILVVGALTVYDLVYQPVVQFPNGGAVKLVFGWQNIQYMIAYQGSLTISGSAVTDPWHYALQWINPLSVSPDPYYVTTVSANNVVVGHPIDWQGIGNLALWYSMIPLGVYLGYKFTKKHLSPIGTLIALWVMVEYGANLYTSYIVHRIVYAFYMLDLTPALVIGVPLLIGAVSKDAHERRILYLMFLAEAIIWFIIFFPIHPWLM